MNTHQTLAQAITEYDRKESTKPGYNPYALGIMLGQLPEIDEALSAGKDLRKTLIRHFNGRLLDRCLKACGLATGTLAEHRNGRWCRD